MCTVCIAHTVRVGPSFPSSAADGHEQDGGQVVLWWCMLWWDEFLAPPQSRASVCVDGLKALMSQLSVSHHAMLAA